MSNKPRVLRGYQTEAVESVFAEWGSETRRTAVVLPTGTGKSSVIAKIAVEAAGMGLSVVMLAHRAELLDQMARTITDIDPTQRRAGIVRAGQNEANRRIVAASFQTLMNDRRHAMLGPRQVVLVDETHHVTADKYREVVEGFGPDIFFCGFTATLRREDGKALRFMIDSVAYERDLRWAIAQGYLVRPSGLTVKMDHLDLGKVKTVAGDFKNKELAEVMEAETPEIVKAILKHCADRRPIIFAASVDAAHDIAAALSARGMAASAVTGAMSYQDRLPIYADYRTGAIQALVTVQVLTEGADFPMCDAVVIARPTQSQNLYSQMVGRALRLYEGKDDALVLDLVGSSRVMKLVTISSLDAGVVPRVVDKDGEDIPPEPDDMVDFGDADKPERLRRLGPLETIGIDLLGPAETPVLWLTTRKGVPFVAPHDCGWAVFLWETLPGMYKVGTMSVKGDKSGGWLEDGRPMDLIMARAVAEDYIMDTGYSAPYRSASWRKSQAPSEGQLRFAKSLRIDNADQMDKARLSDEITTALLSNRLDGAR